MENPSVKTIEKEMKEIEYTLRNLEDKRRIITKQINNLNQKHDSLNNQLSQLLTLEQNSKDWNQETYPWSKQIKDILKNKFGFDDFQYRQLSAINATLSGKDVIVIMPTGGGKSLIYQLPALYSKGVTLVVSPLLSLITDQLKNLTKIGINAMTINSTNSKAVGTTIFNSLSGKASNNLKLLYVTPEYLSKSKKLMSYLQKCYERKALDRIAIDEVHCCSMWGHDFRPDYKNLHIFKNIFPDIPIIGVTATATEKVILESQELLGISGCLVLKASYNRPNLKYKVLSKGSNMEEVGSFLEKLIKEKYKDQSGIIYTHSINDSVDLATELKKRGIKAGPYNAVMEADQRDRVYNKWLAKDYSIICATVAFGMGIDKPDVKFVIHHSLPKSMENYYQESGRAGRDGKSADCILLYSLKDVFRVSAMVAASSQNGLKHLYEIVKYCLEPTRCRRALIAVHFNEKWDQSDCKKNCDNCRSVSEQKSIDIIKFYRDLVKLIRHRKDQFESNTTSAALLDAWFQSGSGKKYKCDDIPVPRILRELGEHILMFLILNDFLKESLNFTVYTTISYIVKGSREPFDKILMPLKADNIPSSLLNLCDDNTKKNLSVKEDKKSNSSSKDNYKHKSKSQTSPNASTSKKLKIDSTITID